MLVKSMSRKRPLFATAASFFALIDRRLRSTIAMDQKRGGFQVARAFRLLLRELDCEQLF